MAEIRAAAEAFSAELLAMRKVGGNRFCADCGRKRSTWAAISATEKRGVFVCIDCAQVHRCAGTHVSRVKNCLGTYLWHPDEMEAMRNGGNDWAARHYGCRAVLDRSGGGTLKQQEALPLLLAKYTGPRPAETASPHPSCKRKNKHKQGKIKRRNKKTVGKRATRRLAVGESSKDKEEKIPAAASAANTTPTAETDFFEAMLATPVPETVGCTLVRTAPMNFEDWLNH